MKSKFQRATASSILSKVQTLEIQKEIITCIRLQLFLAHRSTRCIWQLASDFGNLEEKLIFGAIWLAQVSCPFLQFGHLAIISNLPISIKFCLLHQFLKLIHGFPDACLSLFQFLVISKIRPLHYVDQA